jgi:hypothetical protein
VAVESSKATRFFEQTNFWPMLQDKQGFQLLRFPPFHKSGEFHVGQGGGGDSARVSWRSIYNRVVLQAHFYCVGSGEFPRGGSYSSSTLCNGRTCILPPYEAVKHMDGIPIVRPKRGAASSRVTTVIDLIQPVFISFSVSGKSSKWLARAFGTRTLCIPSRGLISSPPQLPIIVRRNLIL